jgi:ATP-binding cassette subfamily C protein
VRLFFPSASPRSDLSALLGQSQAAFVGIALLSAVLNVLLLGGSIYMMLVYDMVLPGRSVPTLVGLFAMVTLVYIFQALLDHIRSKLLLRVSHSVDAGLARRVHRLIGEIARARNGDALQPMRDLDQVRGFLSGGGPTAIIDLPWMFFFIAVLFILHPLIGATVLAGGLVLVVLTVLTDSLSAAPLARVTAAASARHLAADGTRRHAEVLRALGMEGRVCEGFARISGQHLAANDRLAGVAGSLGGISKVFRLLLQSTVLTVGALLVMDGKASGGVIFASSILSSRALAPVEAAIANWRSFMAARASWRRLKALINALPALLPVQTLSAPVASLSVEGLSVIAAGTDRQTVRNVSFRAQAGEAIAILGPSGCGKSTLMRALVGAVPSAGGAVRLDGAALEQWAPDVLGRHIGYLPQNVELLGGTIAANISRFDADAAPDRIVDAAKLAGVHQLVLDLPDGYNSAVGQDGSALSAGQRQRIALARAVYGDPFLIALDEPNSNLDEAGERALADAVRAATARGAIVLIVAHRASILDAVHKVLLMQDGEVRAFGSKEAIIPDRRRPVRMPERIGHVGEAA